MEMLSDKEMDMLLDVFEFYKLNKIDKDMENVSVFFNQMYETGDIGDAGDLYIKSKPLHDLKHKARNNIDKKRVELVTLRNKLFNLNK